MINLRDLISLLPSYFKRHDTYKDDEGKGILERFLEVVGNFLVDDSNRDTSTLPNIDNILDILDVENTRAVFLDYLFDFLGNPPQEYKSPVMEGEFLHNPPFYVWYLEYQTPLIEITRLGYKSENPTQSKKHYSIIDRKLIKYAISLYKIRGTQRFYEVMLNSYFFMNGYKLLEETINRKQVNKVMYDSESYYDNDFRYDGDSMDCKSCSSYIIDLTSYNSILLPDEKNRIRKTFEKYSPINVELKVAYDYVTVNIEISGPEVEQGAVIIKGEGKVVKDYTHTVSITLEPGLEFVGWYDDNGGLLSKSYKYSFKAEASLRLVAKYK